MNFGSKTLYRKNKWVVYFGWTMLFGVYTNVSRVIGICFGPFAIIREHYYREV